jgi:hypothetical protein
VIKKTLLKTNIGLLLEEVLFMQNFKIPLVGRRDTIAICFFRNTIAICYSSTVAHVALAIPFRACALMLCLPAHRLFAHACRQPVMAYYGLWIARYIFSLINI